MNTNNEIALIQRANVLFPRCSYLSESAVLHARRGWVASRLTLGSKWILDKQVVRLQ